MSQRWNHNIAYHHWILEQFPAAPGRVLDVGCGEGMLARELSARGAQVVGIDAHGPSIALAMATPEPRVTYVLGDVLTHAFAPASFDGVVSVATLHQMDPAAGLARMAELLRPGGRLVVVGCARSELPRDAGYELAAAVGHRSIAPFHTLWEHASPTVWPPPHTYREIRAVASATLPGSRFRRRLLWRYSLAWVKPGA